MAVTQVREIPTGREGGFNPTETEAVRAFRVTTNSPYDDDTVIFNSGMLPLYGSAHPRNNALLAREFKARQEHGALIWIATVGYNNRNLSAELPKLAQDFQPNPLLRRVKITGKSVHTKEAMTKAYSVFDGTITDWAGGSGKSIQGFETPVQSLSWEPIEGFERDVDQFVWTITWNVQTLPFWLANYNNTINDGTVQLLGLSLPRWSLKFRGFGHSDLLEEKVGVTTFQYYAASFDIHYKRDLWITAIPNRGFLKIVAGDQKEILLADGSKPVVPVPLTTAGAVLSTPSATNIIYRFFAPHPPVSFSSLPIPP